VVVAGYSRLSAVERVKIEALWGAGLSLAAIARELSRPRCTITREIQRASIYRYRGVQNPRSFEKPPGRRGPYNNAYSARAAQKRARDLAPFKVKRRVKLKEPGPLRDAVLAGLRERWSPRQISRRLGLEHPGDPSWCVSHGPVRYPV
jgi:IS30 family transposase